ncbi:MAG: hypothetical protein CM15mP71_2750 [Candidatus Poseidoniales archaeon]|nr:MAG: hypothetical protein CM15mP71_2750 [Candidatus Poseidoniales archaeon]
MKHARKNSKGNIGKRKSWSSQTKVSKTAGDVAKEELNHPGNSNAAVGMAISGARGSMDNLTMMAGSIGQAKVRGARLERGYHQRVLPHFKRGGLGATEKGFISSSFKRGLEPQNSSCYRFRKESFGRYSGSYK